jgi:hypothetical protein
VIAHHGIVQNPQSHPLVRKVNNLFGGPRNREHRSGSPTRDSISRQLT